MSNLVPLFTMLERAQADELRLTPGEPPRVTQDGQRRDVASIPMNARLIMAAASDLLSQDELADLPSARPRIVRHEHGDVLYVIEIAKVAAGIELVIRPAKTAPQRIQLPRDAPRDIGPKSKRSRQMHAPSVSAMKEAAAALITRNSPVMPENTEAPQQSKAKPGPDPYRPTVPNQKKDDIQRGEEARRESPQPRREEPQPRREEPQPRREEPQPRREEPRHESPQPRREEPAAAAPAAVARSGSARVDKLLREMLTAKASDLHLSAGNHPVMRVHGEIHFVKEQAALTSSDVRSLVEEIMTEKAKHDFAELHDADFAYEIPGLARFRVNVFEDRNGVGSVMRQIPIEIVTADKLGLPKACLDLCWLSKGLVVVTGPTGSGKSTTLAAMIDFINKNRSDHIITIEDPVEFVHKNIKCLVNQREVGQNTKSFKNALRAALREDPDIVLVGEMRDLETIAIAIETAETGHLVFGTLHTTTAVSTVDRIIDQFPTDRQAQIRVMLSESLKGVVAQVLCKKVGGGRVAAHEIVLGSPAVTSLIRDGKTFQLASVMQTSKNVGMVTMNDSLMALVQNKQVEPKEAWLKATDKSGLLSMFKNAGIPTAFA